MSRFYGDEGGDCWANCKAKGLLVDDQIMIVANILWWVNITIEDFAIVVYGGFNNAELSDALRIEFRPGGSLEPQAYSWCLAWEFPREISCLL